MTTALTAPPLIATSIRRSDGAVFEGQELQVDAPPKRRCNPVCGCGANKIEYHNKNGCIELICRSCRAKKCAKWRAAKSLARYANDQILDESAEKIRLPRRANRMCECGLQKSEYPRPGNTPEYVCVPCRHKVRVAKEIERAKTETPPLCPKCAQPKTKELSSQSCKGYRWICVPCLTELKLIGYRNSCDHTQVEITIPERYVPAVPKAVKVRSLSQEAIREYRACERRWKQPTTSPTAARGTNRGCHKNNGFKNPVVEATDYYAD